MPGTLEGAKNARLTMMEKLGGEEAYKQYFKDIGVQGGMARVPKGFALSGKASEAGKVGGSVSKRGKKNGIISN